MTDWRPIDSAPRDGTVILVWIPALMTARVARFDHGVWIALALLVGHRMIHNIPTWWMPLPDPPTPAASNAREVGDEPLGDLLRGNGMVP